MKKDTMEKRIRRFWCSLRYQNEENDDDDGNDDRMDGWTITNEHFPK